jgi:hypothetical protein
LGGPPIEVNMVLPVAAFIRSQCRVTAASGTASAGSLAPSAGLLVWVARYLFSMWNGIRCTTDMVACSKSCSPRVPDGPEGGLLVIPSDAANLDAMMATECGSCPSGYAVVGQYQLQPFGGTLLGEVVEHHWLPASRRKDRRQTIGGRPTS